MDIVKGSIVRAKAGRDKDKFFVVLKTDGEDAYIADGKRRKADKPKKKKLIHLAPTNSVHTGPTDTNPKLRQILKNHNGG